MTSPFAAAVAGALAVVRDVAGVMLEYVRGELSVELVGVPGRTLFAGQDAERLLTQYTAHDWLIEPGALVLDAAAATPEPGDLIRHTDEDTIRTYEVMLQGDQCYRLDPTVNLLRVYTKLIDSAAA